MKYVLIILVLIVVPLVAGQTDLGYYQYEEEANLVFKCEDDGDLCSGAECNISVQDPQGVFLVNLEPATNNLININYTLASTNVADVGVYEGQVYCIDAQNDSDVEPFFFEVTYTGREDPHGLVILAFLVGFIVILGYALLSLALMLDRLSISSPSELNFDIIDLVKVAGGYFAFLGFWVLQLYYLNFPIITGISQAVVDIGFYTHLMLPMILFLFSLTIGKIWRKGAFR